MKAKNINQSHLDENVVRIIAAQVVLLASFSLLFELKFVLIILILDFAIRGFTKMTSPLAIIAKGVASLLNQKPRYIFAQPKKVAAGLGFVFAIIILVLLLLKIYLAAYLVGLLLIFCAVLESAFKICIGCYVHNLIIAPIINKFK